LENDQELKKLKKKPLVLFVRQKEGGATKQPLQTKKKTKKANTSVSELSCWWISVGQLPRMRLRLGSTHKNIPVDELQYYVDGEKVQRTIFEETASDFVILVTPTYGVLSAITSS
jgi:hypothetical protein